MATSPNPYDQFDSSGENPYDQFDTRKTPKQMKEASLFDRATGYGEAALSVATGIPAAAAGAASGIARNLVSGKFGTQEGVQEGQRRAEEVAGKFTYQPSTEQGKTALSDIGRLFEGSKLAGVGPSEAIALSSISPRGITAPAQNSMTRLGEIGRKETPMAGGGSALSDIDRMRLERAQALPIPIKLTKGQATRSFEQQQFERETAKHPKIGEPLRERFAEQNQQILQNFDAWVDQTGAEAGSLRATGQAVTDAIVSKSQKAKGEIRAAYMKARESGAMSQELDVSPLQGYLNTHKAEAINAPVLSSVDQKISSLMGNKQTLSINELEEVRKMVGKLSGKDATNATFGREVKQIIDGMTEGKGGTEYKQARALRYRYGKEFEDRAVVSKLMDTKPGTMDRAVAYEDVFSHSIMKGSLDDVRSLRRTLQTAGPQGQQAWKELQGATIQHLKDEISRNSATDIRGNRVVSAARLDRLVTELDKDGKLDFVFGKQGAQQIRDVNGIAKDVLTSPPGSVNTSNTASILIGLLDTAVSGTAGAPLPIGTALNYGIRRLKDRAMIKKVEGSLNPVPLRDIGQIQP